MTTRLQFGFALEYVDDVAAATRFYVEVMGLVVRREHPQFVQFDAFAIASDEALGRAPARELYWVTDDAERAHAEIRKKVPITVALRTMPFGKVFGFEGATGEPCFVVELAASRPSQRVG